MRINDDVYMLALPLVRDGQTSYFNASVILDEAHGPTLVDAGLPGQYAAIGDALAEAGVAVADLRRVILTHQDLDHIGSLQDVVHNSGAQVLASAVETPFIDGTTTPRYATAAAFARNPHYRAIAEQIKPTPIDQQLADNERLDLAGGTQVIYTPGHTPGHCCLFLERTGTLIAGDALGAADGQLVGPNAGASMDIPTANASVQRLAALPVRTIICYHGGVVHDGAAQLRRVAQELADATASQ